MVGYALLGATWLILKTEGELQAEARIASRCVAGVGTLALIGVVSLWTPFLNPVYFSALVRLAADRFTSRRCRCWSAPAALRFIARPQDRASSCTPFLAALGLFVLSYAGLGISFYPYIVPGSLTIWEAAAPDSSLAGSCWSARSVLIPIILTYTGYAYWVFRGKVDPTGAITDANGEALAPFRAPRLVRRAMGRRRRRRRPRRLGAAKGADVKV